MSNLKEKNESIDIILDLETFGISTDAPVIQIAAATFDLNTGEIDDWYAFNELLDIAHTDSLNVNGSTLAFWFDEKRPGNIDVLTKFVNSDKGLSDNDLWVKFHTWLLDLVKSNRDKSVKIWGNGISFDVMMIKYNFDRLGLKFPIAFWNERDVRTLVDLACRKANLNDEDFKKNIPNTEKHDAFSDIKWEAAYLKEAWAILNDPN